MTNYMQRDGIVSSRERDEIDRDRIKELVDRDEGVEALPRPVIRRPLSVHERPDRPFIPTPRRTASPYDVLVGGAR